MAKGRLSNHWTSFQNKPTLFRISGFLLLQLLFIILAVVCLKRPLPVRLTSTSAEVRGAFSVISVAWQFIAVLLVNDLLFQVISEEWSVYLLKQPFKPGCDKVSTLTANIFFHFRHVFTRSTSMAYQATIGALLVLTILRTTSPATMTTAIAPVSFSQNVELMRYIPTSFNPSDRSDPVMVSIQRAEVITRLESSLNNTIGTTASEKVLVGRLKREDVGENSTVVYPSNVAKFGYTCLWEQTPQIQIEGGNIVVSGSGKQWRVWNTGSMDDVVVGIYTLYDASNDFNSLSAYLFLGCSGFNVTGACLLDLSSIPTTTYNLPSNPRIQVAGTPSTLTASLLVCNPNFNITTVRIQASNQMINMLPDSENLPVVNNLPRATAALIYSTAFLGALSPLSASPGRPAPISSLATKIFVDVGKGNVETWMDRANFTVKVMDMETIQRNMDDAMMSASKAFLIKPVGEALAHFTAFEAMEVPALVYRPTIILVTSRFFLAATVVMLGILILLGIVIICSSINQQSIPLNLKGALRILDHGSLSTPPSTDAEETGTNKPLPIIIGDYHILDRSDNSSDGDSLYPPMHDSVWYWPRKFIYTRVISFMLIQLAYYGVAIAGYVRPYNLSKNISIALSNHFTELKGGFIILFTILQTFSIAILSDILFTIFSLEWVVKAEKNRTLEPGKTDEVSTLASGLWDRIKYAFKREKAASGMFRYSFAASLVLLVLSAAGPGCFTLSTTAIVQTNTSIRNIDPNLFASRYLFGLGSAMTKEQAAILEHSALVTQLEQVEGFDWGYKIPPNLFIPWPFELDGTMARNQQNLKYPARTFHFKNICRWERPDADDLEVQQDIEIPITTGMIPVKFRDINRNSHGHIGVLLVGCEGSSQQKQDCLFNLDGLSTSTEANRFWNGTATLLACDPSNQGFDSGPRTTWNVEGCTQISVVGNEMHTQHIDCSNLHPVYISDNNLGNIFSSSLLFALHPPKFHGGHQSAGAAGIGILAGQLLFDNFTAMMDSKILQPIASIPMPEIENKLDKYLTSASKPFMAGYNPFNNSVVFASGRDSFATTSVSTEIMVAQVTLVGNKAVIIISIILLVIALRLLQLGLRGVFWKQSRLRMLEPFNIDGVRRVRIRLQKEQELQDEI